MKARVQSGNITVIAGIAIVPLAMIIAMASELVALSSERALMQSAADAAALSGAQNLTLVGASARQSTEDVERFAMAQVGEFANRATVSFNASQGTDGSYTVEGLAVRSSFFGDLVPPGGFRIEVKSIAESMQVQPLCIIGDDASSGGKAITAANNSGILARNCLVHANSNFELTQNATVEAGTPRATGVASGPGFTPAANSGALKMDDPFRSRAITMPMACTSVPQGGSQTHSAGTVTLKPGMHRTEYTMTGTAVLRLEPGDHYFCKNLKLTGNGRLEGEDVLLMFNGGNSLQAGGNSSVSLSGRRSGNWAGFVIVATRTNYHNFTIASSNVDKLLGTIYLPMTKLLVSAGGSVAEGSQWSVIVARNIHLSVNARLVINTDYEGSPVPVPIGVGNQAGGANVPLRLRQ
jgi:hypothetical protein